MNIHDIGSTSQSMHEIATEMAGTGDDGDGAGEPPQPPVSGRRRRWFVPTIRAAEFIAIGAFIFSVGNAFFAYCQISGEQHHQSRIEMNDVIQRLGDLQRSAIELNQQCLGGENGPTPQQTVVCNSTALQFRAEQRALVDIGKTLTEKLGDDVESSEFRTLALVLSSLNDNSGARDFLDRAIETASDVQDRVSALQLLANIQFVTSPEDGRETYERSLGLVREGTYSLEIDRGLLTAQILRDWSQNESVLGDCEQARTVFLDFLKAARDVPLAVREPFLGLAVPDDDSEDEEAGDAVLAACQEERGESP